MAKRKTRKQSPKTSGEQHRVRHPKIGYSATTCSICWRRWRSYQLRRCLGRLPAQVIGVKVANFPHTAWMLLEHMRLAQWDILEFSRNAKHVSPKWPEGYWPASEAPA